MEQRCAKEETKRRQFLDIAAEMALLSSIPSLSFASPSHPTNSISFPFHTTQFYRRQRSIASSNLSSTLDTNHIDKSFLNLAEAFSEEELWAAACLRIRSFYEFRPSAYGIRVSPTLSFHLTFEMWVFSVLVSQSTFEFKRQFQQISN